MPALAQWTREAVFTATAASAPSARRFLTGSLVDHSIPSVLAEDVALVGSELVTHALLHAPAPFTVRLSQRAASLRLEVVDRSPSELNPVALRVVNERGRAMAVVDALSTQWGVTTVAHDGKPEWALWAVFDVHEACPPPS